VRQIPLPILREIQFGNPAIVDLVEVYVSRDVQPDLRFALFDQDVTWYGQEYAAAGFRTPLRNRQSLTDSMGDLTLTLPDVGRELASLLQSTDIAGTPVLIRRVLLNRLHINESLEYYRGAIRAPIAIEGTTVVITLIPRCADPDDLRVLPGRPYSFACTARKFGDPDTCGVVLSEHRYSGSVGEGSSVLTIRDEGLTPSVVESLKTKIGVDDDGADILSAVPGVVIFDSGVNEGQSRPVAAVNHCSIELRKPFSATPAVGDSFRFERRCAKTADACEGFDNLDRHLGFGNSPKEPRNLMRELLR